MAAVCALTAQSGRRSCQFRFVAGGDDRAGLTTLTRSPRPLRSTDQLRTISGRLWWPRTPKAATPMIDTIEPLMMMDCIKAAPSQ